MSNVSEEKAAARPTVPSFLGSSEALRQELGHLRSGWWWFFLLGVLLMIGGVVALLFPILTNVAAMVVLGVTLVVSGFAMVVSAFWAGKWGGVLLQLLIGILYVVVGMQITEMPVKAGMVLAVFVAGFFIVAGAFRVAAALTGRFPHWGWALLNGVITRLCGIIIYRHFPECSLWVVGILVGLEMFFNGLNWIMLGLAVRSIPEKTA